jgi:outer membrane putative beta-barrel porin/alpha-amylase
MRDLGDPARELDVQRLERGHRPRRWRSWRRRKSPRDSKSPTGSSASSDRSGRVGRPYRRTPARAATAALGFSFRSAGRARYAQDDHGTTVPSPNSLALTFLGAAPALAEDDPLRWALSTSFNYSEGDYGTGANTTLIYVPFTLGVRPIDRLDLSLTIPYLRQSSQNIVITGGGIAPSKHGRRLVVSPARQSVSTTEDGLGDLLLKGRYLLEEKPLVPETAPYLKIKLPTADSDRGLGTGEFDETVGVDLSKTFAQRLTGYLTVAYTFIGSPSGTTLDNSFGWSIGTAYAVTSPLSVFAFLDGATAITPGTQDPLEVRVGAEYKLTKALKVTGSVTKGFTDGSPDWGVSVGLALRF